MLDNALSEFDAAIAAVIAYDEVHDPERVDLVRRLFHAQRGVYAAHGREIAAIGRAVAENTSAVRGIAERVQGHIERQLMDMVANLEKAAAEQEQTNAQHIVMLNRIGAQDAMLKATHDKVEEIALILVRLLKAEDRAA